jgi:hypothetical protein
MGLVLPAELEHRLIAVVVSAEPTLGKDLLTVVDDFDGRGPLVRIHADDDVAHRVLLDQTRADTGGEGSATSSWADPS